MESHRKEVNHLKISKEEVREQLAALGFRNVPDEVLEEFIYDLQQINPKSLGIKPAKQDYDIPRKEHTYKLYDEEEPDFDLADDEYDSDQEERRRIKKMNQAVSPKKHTRRPTTRSSISDSRPSSARSSSTISIPDDARSNASFRSTGSISSSKPKKTDPVKRYHALNDYWKNDPFLQAQSQPRKIKVIYPDYQPWQPPRKDLNAMRPKYVVPTEKRRDKLRFQVRYAMMVRED